MADIATIGFRAETYGLTRAEQGLDRVAAAGKRTETSMTALQKTVGVVGTALAAIGSAQLASQLTKFADTATSIENRLRTVTNSTEQLSAAQQKLLSIANSTRSEYQATAELFTKLSQSTTELGLSQERLYRITETINKSFAASGASAAEAGNAIRQLAQGLSAGALRGDEFNSVAEQAPEILRAVAAETGKTTGQLREFAAEGGITAELLIKSLENYGSTVDRVYGKTNATLEQSRAIASNNAIEWVGNNKLIMGATAALGTALVTASENLDGLTNGIAAAATVYTASLIPAMASSVSATYQKIAADIAATNTARALAAEEMARVAASKAADAASAQSSVLALQLDAQRKRSALEALAAESALEKQRLAAQISETGRIHTATRMAEIGTARAAINRQLAVTELELAAATSASNAAAASAVAAQTALAGAATRTTAASAALGAATSFLLGPWGLLITALGAAATAFYLTRDSAAEATAKMDEQAAAVSKLAEKYTKFSSGNLAQTYAAAQMQAIELSERRIQIETRLAELAGRADGVAYSERKRLNAELSVTNQNLSKAELAIQAVNKVFEDGIPKAEGMAGGTKSVAVEVDKTGKKAKTLAEKMEELNDEMDAYTESAIFLNDNESWRAFDHADLIQEMQDELDGLNGKIEQTATISEKAAERIEEAFADAWLNAFDGFESVVDGMKNAFKRMLAEMAHMALTKPIMVSMGLGGMLPSAASASNGALSGGLGLLGGVGSGITGLGSLIGGSFGGGLMGGGALVGAGQFGTLFSGAGSLLGSGNIMAGLGMATPIIAGLGAALAGIQKLSGGGLFGTSYKTSGQSLGLSLGGGDVTGSITTEESRKRSLFRGTKTRTSTTGYDASAIDAAFDSISAALGQAANAFGITGADEIIKGFTAAANINIKDKSEAEIQAAIEEWVGNTTGALVNAVFGDSLDGLQKEGEGVVDTVARLTANMGAVQSISKALGLGFDLTGKAAMIASTNIVELAGGLDQLSALTSQYYSAFYSEAEQQQNLATQLAASFEALNVTMPMTREGFRSIVDGLDLTTESGQQMFAALMQLVPGMDQYLTALEAQRTASEQAAEAAQKEAEAKAAALKAQGLDLQVRLYDALGQSAEALALRRQMELEATDETLRAILLQIYAAEDAASAQRELASAQDAAAQSARDAAAAATDAAQNAFGKLQDAAEREKSRLQTELDLKLESIDKEREALAAQRDSVVAGYEAQSDAVRDYISNLQGITEVINDFIGTSGGVVDPFKRLAQIFNEAKAGLIPNQSELQSVLGAIGSADSSRFASATDQARAMAAARNQAAGIGQLIGGASGAARSQLGMLQTQISMAEDYYSQQMLKLDAASEQAKKLHDEQGGKIDEQLTEAQKQLNALLGVDDRILSMTDAITEFYAALDKANELTLSVETAQLDALNRVESAIVQVGAQLIEMNKPSDRVWVPPTQPDRYTTNGEPISQEMVNLLNQILSAQESTAKHTAKTADTLQRVEMDGLDTRAVV